MRKKILMILTMVLAMSAAQTARAQGIGIDLYNLTLDDNWAGGASTVISNVSGGTNITLPSRSRDGFDFAGWSKNADGSGTVYAAGSSYTVTMTETLYGKWSGGVIQTVGSLKYRVTSESYKTAELVGYEGDGPTGSFAIPASITLSGYDYDVTSIGENAFDGCTGMTSVSIGSGVATIGDEAFMNCTALEAFDVDGDNAAYKSVGGVLYSRDGSTLLAYPIAKSGTAYDIPDGVTNIKKSAFRSCTALTDITIPATVTTIDDYAFKGCTSLTAVVIPASVNCIGSEAFADCTSLATVYIYGSSIVIGSYAFIPNADGRKFYVYDEYNVGFTDDQRTNYYSGAFVEYDHSVTGVKAHQNPEATNENWFTFYHPAANVEIGETRFDVEIYKATLNGTNSVTLTKIEGNKIKAGNAVLVRLVKASSLDWDSSWDVAIGIETGSVDGDYSGNDLRGGSTVAAGYDAYTLAAKSGVMGFYKFAGAALDANKAHLEIAQSSPSPARGFIGFGDGDNTTGIETPPLTPPLEGAGSGCAWYSLDGRRLQGEPTAKGVYIVNGRKFIVK